MSVQEQANESVGGVLHGTVVSVSSSDAYTFSKPVRDEIVLVPGLGVDGDTHAGVNVRHRSRVRADPSQPNLRQVHLIRQELFEEVGEQGFAVKPGQLGENVTTGGLDLFALPVGTILRFGDPARPGTGPAPAGSGGGSSDSGSALAGSGGGSSDSGSALAGSSGGSSDPGSTSVGSSGGPSDSGSAAWGTGSAADVVADVVAAARGAKLDGPTAVAVDALVAAAERDSGDDPRPAVAITGMRNPCAQIDRFQDGLLGQVAYRDADGVFVRKAGIMGVVLRGGPVRPGDMITAELPPQPHVPLERV